ncbi:hypothetical protein BHM03_00058853, partial [Ensete ventricosum]
RRPLVPMCRSVGEAGDWGGGRDFAAPAKERMSVDEADVATVDGLESTIKSARDRKRWTFVLV